MTSIPASPMFLGLRTVIYPAPDLEATKSAFTALLGVEPYFDEPFYVGFEVAGYELGLEPDADPSVGPVAYWGVSDIAAAIEALVTAGATVRTAPSEVGGGIKTATVQTAHGDVSLIDAAPVNRSTRPFF